MNRKKLIIAIAAMTAMIAVGIVIPTVYRVTKNKQKAAEEVVKEVPARDEKTQSGEPSDARLEFLEFQELSAFFSESQIDDLKAQIPEYLEQAGITGITSVKFLKDQTSYPSSTDTLLSFTLSDDSTLPVLYSAPSGAFLFGEEKLQLHKDTRTYERQTDESLPEVSAEEVEELQEGGYADTEATPDKEKSKDTPSATEAPAEAPAAEPKAEAVPEKEAPSDQTASDSPAETPAPKTQEVSE